MKVPQKVKKLFERMKYVSFATSDSQGKPNVVAVGSKRIVNEDTIWIIDTYFDKTKNNLLSNKYAAICFWQDSSEGYQIKGLANYYMDGKVYDEAKKWILKSKPDKIVKGVVEFKVTEIFSIAAKPEEAGKKLV